MRATVTVKLENGWELEMRGGFVAGDDDVVIEDRNSNRQLVAGTLHAAATKYDQYVLQTSRDGGRT